MRNGPVVCNSRQSASEDGQQLRFYYARVHVHFEVTRQCYTEVEQRLRERSTLCLPVFFQIMCKTYMDHHVASAYDRFSCCSVNPEWWP